MKLEPIKKAKLPQYAGMLAAMASTAVFTGCQTAGETVGTAPDSNIAEQTVSCRTDEYSEAEQLELAGEVEFESEETEYGTDLFGAEAGSEKADNPDSAEPLLVEGDVIWVPDYQEATDYAAESLSEEHI